MGVISKEDLIKALKLGQKIIPEIIEIQKKALKAKYNQGLVR